MCRNRRGYLTCTETFMSACITCRATATRVLHGDKRLMVFSPLIPILAGEKINQRNLHINVTFSAVRYFSFELHIKERLKSMNLRISSLLSSWSIERRIFLTRYLYNCSRCYCKIAMCRYVDLLVLLIGYLRSLSVRSCHSTTFLSFYH